MIESKNLGLQFGCKMLGEIAFSRSGGARNADEVGFRRHGQSSLAHRCTQPAGWSKGHANFTLRVDRGRVKNAAPPQSLAGVTSPERAQLCYAHYILHAHN